MASLPGALLDFIAGQRDTIIDWQRRLTAFRALGPENSPDGELPEAEGPKAAWLEALLRGFGVNDITRIDAPDARVRGGSRPNIAARLPGRSPRTLWIMAHMDVVPVGDLDQWRSDPWTVTVDGDRLYGRGVEDNQQGLVGALLAAQALTTLGVTPDLSLGILLVSDEECGNAYGIEHVLEARPDLFRPGDGVLAPDCGVPDGSCVEIAEKAQCWLKVEVIGQQCHASRPQDGRNTLVAAAEMILAVEEVAKEFPRSDPLFSPPESTFAPTRHEGNVPNVNTVPGRDVFYIDCRLLPGVEPEAVLDAFRRRFGEIAERRGVRVSVDIHHLARATEPTSPEDDVVRRLFAGIAGVYGLPPRCIGVGGGTVAASFRRRGMPASVWASLVPTAHSANEYSLLSRTIGDAQVMVSLLFDTPLPPRVSPPVSPPAS